MSAALFRMAASFRARCIAEVGTPALSAAPTVEATRWQSRATFISDNDGQVDVAHQAPVSGTYEGIAPMGLFWSMDRLPSDAGPAPPGAIMLPVPIRLEAEATDGRRAEITIVRGIAGPGVTRQVIRTDGLVGTLFLPPGAGPHRAVHPGLFSVPDGTGWSRRRAACASCQIMHTINAEYLA
jgi:hypothetical protein